ncbi:MAG: SpoIIE family protein phosphatase [Planctomycetes bacterium]|nr:SpoIIE family protein phosphatase [Planctomycetota bacterium]
MAKLVIKSGPSQGKEVEIAREVVIGRGSQTHLVLDDAWISRRHAAVTRKGDDFVVADLQSGNGTRVNGVRITGPRVLQDGDEIQLGVVAIEFQSDSHQAKLDAAEESEVTLSDAGEDTQEVLQVLDATSAAVSMVVDTDSQQAVKAMSRRLQLLYEMGAVIGTVFNEQQLLALIMDKLFEVFPQAERGFIMLYDAENNRLLPKVARSRKGNAIQITVSRTLVRDAIEKRRGILSADAMGDSRFAMGQSIHNFQIRSVICVPMMARDEIVGVVHIDGSDPRRAFTKEDMALLMGISSQAALALANARLHDRVVKQRLMEQDLELANRIQQKFLPQQPPHIEGYEFRDEYTAALEVGGDYYDFLQLPDQHLGIVIGDVSGKGVSAALYMAKLSSDVRFHSAGQTEPGDILTRLNRAMAGVEEGMFVTLLFLSLDTRTGVLKMANAGHLPPRVRKASGEILELDSAGNFPLGLYEEVPYEQASFPLGPGDTVAVFTDGVVEAADPEQKQFGWERLSEVMKASGGRPGEMLERILDALKTFCRGAVQSDDITLVCFGRRT